MELDLIPVVIPSGQALSGAAELATERLVGIIGPTAFDGTGLNFETSVDGVNWHPMLSPAGSSILVFLPTSGVERFVLLDKNVEWQNLTWLKVKSTAGSGESAERTINLVVRSREHTLTLEC